MSTSWTRTAGVICAEALEQLGVKSPGQTVSAEDMQSALDALDAVLKELPLYGYSWPKLSSEVALPWVSGQSIALPSDYYGYLRVWANDVPLLQVQHVAWNELTNRTRTASTVTHFYVSPANVLYLYPVPESDPTLTIQYQRIVDDASLPAVPDVPPWMVNALGYGVASELLFKYGVTDPIAGRIEQRWQTKRALAISNAVSNEAISFGVADDRIDWTPVNWQACPCPTGSGWVEGGWVEGGWVS